MIRGGGKKGEVSHVSVSFRHLCLTTEASAGNMDIGDRLRRSYGNGNATSLKYGNILIHLLAPPSSTQSNARHLIKDYRTGDPQSWLITSAVDDLFHLIDLLQRCRQVLVTMFRNKDVICEESESVKLMPDSRTPNEPSILTPPTAQYPSSTSRSIYCA